MHLDRIDPYFPPLIFVDDASRQLELPAAVLELHHDPEYRGQESLFPALLNVLPLVIDETLR